MQVKPAQQDKEVRVMLVGIQSGASTTTGWPRELIAGRHITAVITKPWPISPQGFKLGEEVQIRRNHYRIVGLTKRMVSSSGDPMLFIPLKDAQEVQF